jgi:Protein of unknown function (DUF2892)
MDVNLSTLDRIVRLIVGTMVISLGYIQNDNGLMIDKWVSWGVGLMPIVSALFGRCPIYRMLGISTCPKP